MAFPDENVKPLSKKQSKQEASRAKKVENNKPAEQIVVNQSESKNIEENKEEKKVYPVREKKP